METALAKLLRPYQLAFTTYPIHTIVALNYADFALTAILVLKLWESEANPIIIATGGVFSLFNMANKLIISPLLAMFVMRPIYLRYRDRPRIGRAIKIVVSLLLIFYLYIVAVSLGAVIYHMGLL